VSQEKVVLCDTPNKFARSPLIELYEHSAVFHGYQEFVLTRDTVSALPVDSNLQAKQTLLAPYFEPRYLRKRTVLDLGANAGFFCFWALQKGAQKAVAVDIDDAYLQMVRDAKTHLEFHDLDVVKANVANQKDPADIVLATALVHWIYSCTALFGCLDAVVEKLARLTNYMLIVEWIDPEDSAIGFFHHTDWNKDAVSAPYDLSTFEKALTNNFKRYRHVGDISPTRRLYVAFNTEHEIDLSAPLPLILPEKALIHSKLLTKNDGAEYWSRVYDGGDVIKKQATLDLAAREAFFLSQLESNYFPKVLAVESEGSFSLLTLEKIDGQLLSKVAGNILATPSSFYSFIQHCLRLLGELAAQGITHRDIRPDNILFRDSKPVLIDFGWAVSDANPYFTPKFLGDIERPQDGSFCDAYSMGKVLKGLNAGRYPEFDLVLDLMVEEDASLRIIDLHILEDLLRVIAAQ
jgi:SAM-dependent methyltransferase